MGRPSWIIAGVVWLACGSGHAQTRTAASASEPSPARADLAAQVDVLLRSASDASLDALFAAVHGLAKSPDDSARVCKALSSAERTQADAWLVLAAHTGEPHRQALVNALTDVALSGWQGVPRAFDEKQARLYLRQAGVRAALLDEDFGRGLAPSAELPAAEQEALRCRALGGVLDALAGQPRAERVAVTRLLLREGVSAMSRATAAAPAAPGK